MMKFLQRVMPAKGYDKVRLDSSFLLFIVRDFFFLLVATFFVFQT
jgi:hypothetical protein